MTPREAARLRAAIAVVRASRARTAGDDPVSFARNLGLEPDPWQERLLRAERNVLLNCSRQAGKSTAASMLVVHRAVMKPNHLALLISPSDRQSGELFRKVREFLSRVPGLSLVEDNARSCRLANGSRIVSLPSSADTIRGFSAVDTLVEDEAAFVDDELNMAVRPMLAVSNGQLVLMSTPNGRKGHFHEAWANGADAWHRERVTCWDVPRIPRPFLEEQRLVMGEMFRQEFECEFINAASGRVYEWDEQRDVIETLPEGGAWTWILALDFGVRDRCGASVIGWRAGDPCTYIARSYRFKGLSADAAREVRLLEKDYGDFVQIVGDLGGLGAAFGGEMASRFGIPVTAAKKADKLGHIRLMNGAMRQSRLKVVRGACKDLLEEWRDLPWREDGTREAEGYVADASDSALYGFMASYAHHEREAGPALTREQQLRAEETAIVEQLQAEAVRDASVEWWE